MAINYSKWDALELSDDSDIEVHPNVDKRSFIRAKQNQIHMERQKRRNEITRLKYESQVNDGLLGRIDLLLNSIKTQTEQLVFANPDNIMMQALMMSQMDQKDKIPTPPADVQYKEKQPDTYSEMMARLVDQVKKEIPSDKADSLEAYLSGVKEHRARVQGLQDQLYDHLKKLEKEESSKITSDSIRDGFNTSSVAKSKDSPPKPKQKAETVEVLNTGPAKKDFNKPEGESQTSGADGDVDEPKTQPEEETEELTKLAKDFGQIAIGDYKKDLQFISQNKEVLDEKNSDGLLMEAFDASLSGNAKYSKQCVHQALLLQYCRKLGQDGVGMFFKRIVTPGHNAQKVFHDDVNDTYKRLSQRSAEILEERAKNPKNNDDGEAVEQIQLHAVEPGSQIHINVPLPDSKDEVEQKARAMFERFPPGLQRALESGSLERVNEVLGKMSVSEAEEVVEALGSAGMLSMEQGVIDGTTEEGQARLAQLEKEAAEGKLATQAEPFDAEGALRDLAVGTKYEGKPIPVEDVD